MLYEITDGIYLEGDSDQLKLTVDKLITFVADEIDAFAAIDRLAETHHGWINFREVQEELIEWFINYDLATLQERLAMFRTLLMEQKHSMVLALTLLAISCREAHKLKWKDATIEVVGSWLDKYEVRVGESAIDMFRFTDLMNVLVYDVEGNAKP